MSKKPKQQPPSFRGYLECTECSRVTAINVVPFSFLKQRTRLDCGCPEYGAKHVSNEAGFDAIVRQEIEAA